MLNKEDRPMTLEEKRISDEKLYLADIYMRLTNKLRPRGSKEEEEQVFAEFCSEAEGFLEDWLNEYKQRR